MGKKRSMPHGHNNWFSLGLEKFIDRSVAIHGDFNENIGVF